tara:strand:+ start:3339 stop:6707 length:3369 start_codon:yes stop_codon:yes gene_type:complete
MKAFIFLLCTTVFGITTEKSFSQEKITIEVDKVVSVDEVFIIIQDQTKYRFLYPADLFTNAPKVNLKKGEIGLDELLKVSLSHSAVEFELSQKNRIVIRERNSNGKPAEVFRQLQLQQFEVTGMVFDAKGDPLPGASIVEKGTTNGVTTDFDGVFAIAVENSDAVLVVSYVGFATKEVSLTGQTNQTIILEESSEGLEEVVVIGYGTQRKRDVTGSISSVNSEEIEQRTPTNVFEAIQGQMAGVQINTGSGAPGSGASIKIRGTSTMNGGTDPLYVVDGQPMDNIDSVNPNDIESLEVLKDGASAAIYGSRSTNGVIIVTTKSGKKGKSSVNVNYVKSFSKLRKVPTANAQERQLYDLLKGTEGNALIDTLNQMYYINNDFQDIYFRTASKDQINVSLSSGGEKTNFYWNTGFINQEGLIINSSFKRVNTKINVDHNYSDRIRMGLRLGISYDETKNIEEANETGVISSALIKAAYSPYINPDGSYIVSSNSFRGRANILDDFSRSDVRFRSLRNNVFAYIELDIAKGLKFRSNNGVDINYTRNTWFQPEYVNSQGTDVRAQFFSSLDYNWINEDFLNYNITLGKHAVTALLGFSAQKWSRPEESIKGILANNLIPTLNNLGGLESLDLNNTYTLNQNDHSLLSYFGRATYAYDDKYLIATTYRRDGSSRFGQANRWGLFPSIALGWRFSNEKFMENLLFVKDAKLRFSSAITGNERINNRDYDFLLSTSNFYQGLNGVGLSDQLGNPSIQWEETQQNNYGLDLALFTNRLNFTLDYYDKKTSKLLANLPLPSQTGFLQTRVNVGQVRNTGFELTLNAIPIASNDFSWHSDFNISINENVISELADNVPIVSENHITEVGGQLGSFYGYKINGIFAYDESNAFTPDGVQLTPNFAGDGSFSNYTLNGSAYNGAVNQISVGGNVSGGGDYYYSDNDGNFTINDDDRIILGNPYPKYFGGWRNQFKYKNLNFSFLFDYQFDVEVFNSFYSTMSTYTLNSWTPVPYIIYNIYEGPGDTTALFPDAIRSQNLLADSAPTSYWVENADFIKLRSIKLTYDLPEKWTKKLGLKRCTFFGSVNNAFTWTNYRGADPEVTGGNANALNSGVDPGRYPRGREYLLGTNINF